MGPENTENREVQEKPVSGEQKPVNDSVGGEDMVRAINSEEGIVKLPGNIVVGRIDTTRQTLK